MGVDKAFIKYHGIPQWQHTYHLLEKVCDKVFVSCNDKQALQFPENIRIQDSPEFASKGPISGLLSAINYASNVSWLITGCDYPNMLTEDYASLIKNAESGDVICYHDLASSVDIPILAIYHPNTFEFIRKEFKDGETSLRRIIQQFNISRIIPENLNKIISYDSPGNHALNNL